jgi:hypothetical protein
MQGRDISKNIYTAERERERVWERGREEEREGAGGTGEIALITYKCTLCT